MVQAVCEGICAALADGLPGLRSVVEYGAQGDMETPLAMLRLTDMEHAGDPEDGTERVWVQCRWDVFLVVAKDSALDAAQMRRELRQMSAAVAALVHGNRFGVQAMPARFVKVEADVPAPVGTDAACWRVEFEQDIPLGESVWGGEGVPVQTVLVSYTPRIGLEHKESYTEVTDGLSRL